VPAYDYNHVLTKSEIDNLDSDGLDSEKDQIEGLNWNIIIGREKVDEFKKLMCFKDIDYLWTDALCINKNNKQQENEELAKMFQYYKVRLMSSYIFLHFIPRDLTLGATPIIDQLTNAFISIHAASAQLLYYTYDA